MQTQTTTFLEKKTDLCVPKNNFGQKFPSLEIVASEVDNFESEVQAMASELLEELKHASFEPGFDLLSKTLIFSRRLTPSLGTKK